MKQYIRILIVFGVFIITAIPNNASALGLCFWCDTTLSDYKGTVKDKLTSFGENNRQVSKNFKEGIDTVRNFKAILKDAKSENEAFGIIHDKWEKVDDSIEYLEIRFKSLVESTDDLFAFFIQKTNTIKGEDELRDKQLEAIEKSKSKYIIMLQNSKENIETLTSLKLKVNNRITALEVSYNLKTLDAKLITEFSDIEQSVDEIISSLRELESETQTLLSGM